MNLALAFVAGLVSVLSPCVLPMLPLLFGAAAAEHRLAPLVLTLGVSLSFTTIALFVATVGFALGFDSDLFRAVGAVLLVVVGAILLVPAFQDRLAYAGGAFSNWTERRFGGFAAIGLWGQFALGLVLGAVWIPCVGPTLGAASLLASRGENLGAVAATMAVFGIGAALPLAVLGLVSRQAMLRWRARLGVAGSGLKMGLGAVLLATGVLILTGVLPMLETWLVEISPDWLVDLTTRF
jgi:cytochrome c biogenesis protein CcdA